VLDRGVGTGPGRASRTGLGVGLVGLWGVLGLVVGRGGRLGMGVGGPSA